MERLRSVIVAIKVDTNKQTNATTLELEEDESQEKFALRVASAVREALGIPKYAPPVVYPCRICLAPAIRDGYCRNHQ